MPNRSRSWHEIMDECDRDVEPGEFDERDGEDGEEEPQNGND